LPDVVVDLARPEELLAMVAPLPVNST